MPQGKGTYGKTRGRPPKKMNRGGMSTGVSRAPVSPAQKKAIFRNRPDMPKIMPDGTRGGVLDLPELTGQRRPGMKGGGTVAMPKMMARGGKAAKAERKALGVGSVGKEVMRKLGLGAVAGPAAIAVAKGVKSLLKGKPTATRAQLKSLTKKKK